MRFAMRFECDGMVHTIRNDEAKGRTYLTVLMEGGGAQRSFLLKPGAASRFEEGDDIQVRGGIVQQTFKGQATDTYVPTELIGGEHLRKLREGNGAASSPARSKEAAAATK